MAVSRVIEVSFGRSSVALVRIDTAYFYNNGILFKPTDLDLPASYQVHWADSPQALSTLETIGTAEGAPIPDDLWNRSRVIYGWIYLHPTNDSSITGYEVRIYKNVRAGLPDGTEPTPAEQSTIDQLIGALNSAVEQTGQDAESTSQSAQSAESAKTAAESARDTAGEYANDAESSAASASTSASQASTSATASAQSASEAEQDRIDADRYASASAQSASASANSASDAQGYANSASASAQSASGYASSAQNSAQTASAKAQDASTSAQTASQKATESAQSASQALSYKTDAESAKTASQTAQGLAESARDSAITAKDDAESARDDAETARDEAQQAVASISGALAEKAPVITDTTSGAIASFSDGADDLPLKSLVVDINPVQDLSHGDPSPENICPISGWTSVGVNHSGADMTNPTTITINLGQTVYGGKLDVLSGVLTIDRAKYIESGQTNWAGGSAEKAWRWFADVLNPLATIPTSQSELSKAMSDKFKATYTVWSDIQTTVGFLPRGTRLWIRFGADTELTTAQKVKEWFTTNPTEFVYELATPLEIQLTPNQVNSLLGVNNIWADSGDTEAVYRADTKKFIERLTAPDSADMVADANIQSGKYFMVGNSLYKATANIANGSAIIEGTNCIRKSLSEALNEINA